MAAVAVERAEWQPKAIEIYSEHFDQLVALGTRTIGRRDLAEEVVQEAFVKFCTSDCRPAKGKEVSYLRSMVINGARSAARREARRTELIERCVIAPEPIGVEDAVALLVESEQARQAIDGLPLRQRMVMTLRYLVGLSERETAEAVGVSPGTVKIHASRGREAVRQHMMTRHMTPM